ncbi:hypothetical protein [Moellerella wisconsensis]|uniref:hypothetical protein n=1 Tax=Moellerella wisconsensis TaxID=158849 RepID=UPI0030760D95
MLCNKINKKRWLCFTSLLWSLGLFLYVGISLKVIANNSFENDEVRLIIHSQIDRPISGFSINGVHGGNASAYGGGAVTCCGIIKDNIAVVKWTLSVKGSQYDAGMRPEKRKVEILLPDRNKGENNLHVLFLPENKVSLKWSSYIFKSPFDK